MSLKTLNGVNIAGASANDIVVYDAVTQQWENNALSTVTLASASAAGSTLPTYFIGINGSNGLVTYLGTTLTTYIETLIASGAAGITYTLCNTAAATVYNMQAGYSSGTAVINVGSLVGSGSFINLNAAAFDTSSRTVDITINNRSSNTINIINAAVSVVASVNANILYGNSVIVQYGTTPTNSITLASKSSVRLMVILDGNSSDASLQYNIVHYNGLISNITNGTDGIVNSTALDTTTLAA